MVMRMVELVSWRVGDASGVVVVGDTSGVVAVTCLACWWVTRPSMGLVDDMGGWWS